MDLAVAEVVGAVGLCESCYLKKERAADNDSPPALSLSGGEESNQAVQHHDSARGKAFTTGPTMPDEAVLAGPKSIESPTDPRLVELGRLVDLVEAIDSVKAAGQIPAHVKAEIDALDRQIIQEARCRGSLTGSDGQLANVSAIARAVGVNKSTVSRRIKSLLAQYGELEAYLSTLVVNEPPGPASTEKFHLSTRAMVLALTENKHWEELAAWDRIARGRQEAWRALFPPKGICTRREGDRVIITGPGPLPPDLKEAVAAGKAERVCDPPRCRGCGRFLPKADTGRPRKYCDERCRSRHRRR